MRRIPWVVKPVPILMLLATALPAAADTTPGGTFFDDDGLVHEGAIDAIAAIGVTVGCDVDGSDFCPHSLVTRYEVATFLTRALDLDPAEPQRFGDVTGVHRRSVGAIEVAGLVRGCDPPDNRSYCGERPLSRGELASILVRAFDLPPSSSNPFTDDDGSVFEPDIAALAASGITVGCGPGLYCPSQTLTRAELASFLARALDLPTNHPPDPFDGRMLAFRPGASFGIPTILTMEDERRPREIRSGWMWRPTLSADGSSIAFIDLEHRCPSGWTDWEQCHHTLFVMPFGGGPARQLTTDDIDVTVDEVSDLSWSDDGSTIWFSSDDGDATGLWSVDVETGRLSRLATTPSAQVVWSGQGRAAVLTTDDDSGTTLDVYTPDGTFDRSFSQGAVAVTELAWSHDGERLALSTDADGGSLVVVDRILEDQWLLAQGDSPSAIAWSPDDALIAWIEHGSGGPSLAVGDAQGKNSRVVRDLGGWLLGGRLAWSPDGTSLVFTWDPDGVRNDAQSLGMWAAKITGGAPWRLTPPSAGIVSAADWR